MESRLTNLQEEILAAFFRRESEFFLTGGGALAGFYLGHRETHDLDLFTTGTDLDSGVQTLTEVADETGAVLEGLQTSPDFKRFLVRRGVEAVVVDLVRERVAQLYPEKRRIRSIVVDPPEEILANKLCALLSRAEVRDLVDLKTLEEAGYPIETALEPASRKDGGLTPAQLAWVVGQIEIPDGAPIPGNVSPVALREYLAGLRARLVLAGFPAMAKERSNE
ncbi:MAG TPA: nucleotidyl transferase AbiEii/AbiGii toxin family protein [Thermoanaerobaculia bacterium]|jgi:hypothetical protein|nr:nucleotidyl transferase AbiEii/AbiGii toxin family protein [Thermoanaerobaculia bacterium]